MTSERVVRDRATIMDVARAADVSRQTVSNVVNQPGRVAPNTLERVNREIARLGFRPSRAARNLKQERAGAWGLELNSRGVGQLAAGGAAIALQVVQDAEVYTVQAHVRGQSCYVAMQHWQVLPILPRS